MRRSTTTARVPFCGVAGVCGLVATACGAGNIERAPIGALTELATGITSAAGEPNLALGPEGTVYFSYIEKQSDNAHALRFAKLQNGRLTAPRTIASGQHWFVNWADFPMMTVLRSGEIAAHWLQRSGPGKYSYDVKIAVSRDGGATWSAPFTPHRDGTESEHGFVSLFAQGNGFGAVWLDGREYAAVKARGGKEGDGEMTLRSTTFTPDGKLGAEIEVDGRTCDCCQTSVALTSDGPILVYRDRSDAEIRDIAAARLVNGHWTEGKPIHRDQWHVTYCPVNGPAVAARGRDVAVAWFTAANDSPRVLLSFSRDAGASFDAPVRIDTGNPVGRVDVQLLAGGDALVTWLERTPPSAEVRVRRVRRTGGIGPFATVAASSAERPSGFPQMAVAGNTAVFAWTEPGAQPRVRVAHAVVNH